MASSQQNAVRTMDSGLAIMNGCNEEGMDPPRTAKRTSRSKTTAKRRRVWLPPKARRAGHSKTEREDICREVSVLDSLIHALFMIGAIDEMERLQEAALEEVAQVSLQWSFGTVPDSRTTAPQYCEAVPGGLVFKARRLFYHSTLGRE